MGDLFDGQMFHLSCNQPQLINPEPRINGANTTFEQGLNTRSIPQGSRKAQFNLLILSIHATTNQQHGARTHLVIAQFCA